MITALLLAAGLGRRFGGGKLVAPVEGVPLIRHTAESLLRARVDAVLVVTGHEAAAVQSALMTLPLRLVHNVDFAAGMGTSIAAGARALPHEATHALVVLGDQPGAAQAQVVNAVADRARRGDVDVVRARWRGVPAPPTCFSAALFPVLLGLTGDHGPRALLERDAMRSATAWVDIDADPPTDVDTEADLRQLLGRLGPDRGD